MKIKFLRTFSISMAFTVASLTVATSAEASNNVKTQVDWPSFMSRQDMVWNYLPEEWTESAYMGNGMLGLMIYKEPGKNWLRLETGDCSVHDHRARRGDEYETGRLLTGHFALHPKGEIIGGTMRLDIWNAETRIEISTTLGKIHLKSIVHSDKMVIITTASTEGEERGFTWEWVPADADSPCYQYGMSGHKWYKAREGYQHNPKPTVKLTKNGGSSLQRLLTDGATAVCWEETSDGGERTLWASLKHTYPENNAEQLCAEQLREAQSIGLKKLFKTHRDWWHNYYPESFVTLPDGRFENFYWIQMYKLASATRGDRALMDCTGPWLTITPWPNVWWDLNVQLCYWPLNASNRLHLAASLENAIYGNVEQLRQNVAPAYRADALGVGGVTNLQCESGEVGVPGVGTHPGVGHLTWACHNLWLIYRHKMDDTLLREKLFPVLRGAINYYFHFLYKGDDGCLHLPYTYSPEYGDAPDATYDLSLLRWGCQTLLQIADRLHIDDPLVPKWKEVLTTIAPYSQSENGLDIGRGVRNELSHRHYSHLLVAYPLYLINKENADEAALIEKTLNHWISMTGKLQGYSLTGASSISSALGKGDDALRYLTTLLDDFITINTFYKEAGPVIETPLSGAQSIHDMLLQSWGGKIRVFPAVPKAWETLAFSDLLAEGAFTVSASRRGGKTEFFSIKSLAGEPCVFVTDIDNPVFKGGKNLRIEKIGDHTWRANLQKGESVTVYPEGTSPNLVIKALDNAEKNCYGKKVKEKMEKKRWGA